ncbi:MAG: CBS domain-containing protein [bacterium]|nr:CBS domain-containing protein [bacterium]
MHLIVTHENADFDAIASLLGAAKLNPRAAAVLPERINRNVSAFLTLYRGAFPFISREDLAAGKRPPRITRVTVVDARRPSTMKGIKPETPLTIIDHHPNDGQFAAHETFDGEIIGANATLLTERLVKRRIPVSALEATLMALGIYEDTGALTYRSTTPRDVRAAAWLIEHGAALDTVRRYLEPPLSDEQQAVFEQAIQASETRIIQGYPITLAALELPVYTAELSAIAHRLRDTLDPAALFLLARMPQHERTVAHLVCRSTDDAVDAGEIAQTYGGGGHSRAASASIPNPPPLDVLKAGLWDGVTQRVRPAFRAADLMSYGAQTVTADQPIEQIVQRLRRLGHEGFPVLENQRVVGLLTRRQVDRALDHALNELRVRDVMTAGTVTLKPDAPAAVVERTMVETGWGQIPIVDEQDRVIGIVTRTDVLKHWSHQNPDTIAVSSPSEPQRIDQAALEKGLGRPTAALVGAIAAHAADKHETVYLVGGVVRDLLLGRGSTDLDFVVESAIDGAAIRFAETLEARYGGSVSSFKPFGTAKWTFTPEAAAALGIPFDSLPDHVDFAAARSEFYEYPSALPTTYAGGIKLDLARRDFSINTLALQLHSAAPVHAASPRMYALIDEFGGVRDLRQGVIRVLHSLSFIDDPTRILRASRFEHRFGFTIEPRTLELLHAAYPMLRRITGERLRNELTLLLHEPEPERAFALLEQRGILNAIHPALRFDPQCGERFAALRAENPVDTVAAAWNAQPNEPLPTLTDTYWHLIAAYIPPEPLREVCERLLFSKKMTESLIDAAQIVHLAGALNDPAARPSQVTAYLENKILDVHGIAALFAAWWSLKDDPARFRVERFAAEWRHVRATTTGEHLKNYGLKPGKCYGIILNRLRAARLDGEITTDAAETALLHDLIEKGICDDRD